MQLLVIQYQQLHSKYLGNLARHWLQAPWGWHGSFETCRSVIICEIIVHLLVIVQNKKKITVIKFPVTFKDELSTVLPLRPLNYELLLIRKKVVMTYLETLSWNLLEETEYNKERLQSRQKLNSVSSQTSLRRYRYINLQHNYCNFSVISLFITSCYERGCLHSLSLIDVPTDM